MPRSGLIYLVLNWILYLRPEDEHAFGILIGATIIIITGFLDDMLEITAKAKIMGQLYRTRCCFLWWVTN